MLRLKLLVYLKTMTQKYTRKCNKYIKEKTTGFEDYKIQIIFHFVCAIFGAEIIWNKVAVYRI